MKHYKCELKEIQMSNDNEYVGKLNIVEEQILQMCNSLGLSKEYIIMNEAPIS